MTKKRASGQAFMDGQRRRGVFTLARFSEAFLILKASDSGLQTALAPDVPVVMSIADAV